MKVFEIWIVNRKDENDKELWGERPEHRLDSAVDMAWSRINYEYMVVVKEKTNETSKKL